MKKLTHMTLGVLMLAGFASNAQALRLKIIKPNKGHKIDLRLYAPGESDTLSMSKNETWSREKFDYTKVTSITLVDKTNGQSTSYNDINQPPLSRMRAGESYWAIMTTNGAPYLRESTEGEYDRY